MKKNTMMRIASVLLIAVLVTTCAISGTFAKYVSEIESNDSTARVALWKFALSADAEAANIAQTETFDFDVFATVKDTDGAEETDVKNAPSGHIIAPGTSGTASVTIYNQGEVNAEYTVAFSANHAGVPLQWSTNGTDWETDITELNINAAQAINMGGSATISIQWKWAIGSTDDENTADTALGLVGTAAPTFSATVTVTQKD